MSKRSRMISFGCLLYRSDSIFFYMTIFLFMSHTFCWHHEQGTTQGCAVLPIMSDNQRLGGGWKEVIKRSHAGSNEPFWSHFKARPIVPVAHRYGRTFCDRRYRQARGSSNIYFTACERSRPVEGAFLKLRNLLIACGLSKQALLYLTFSDGFDKQWMLCTPSHVSRGIIVAIEVLTLTIDSRCIEVKSDFSLWKNTLCLKLLNRQKWSIAPARDSLFSSFQLPL